MEWIFSEYIENASENVLDSSAMCDKVLKNF